MVRVFTVQISANAINQGFAFDRAVKHSSTYLGKSIKWKKINTVTDVIGKDFIEEIALAWLLNKVKDEHKYFYSFNKHFVEYTVIFQACEKTRDGDTEERVLCGKLWLPGLGV